MTLATALNHALIESLWQGAVVALAFAVTLLVVRSAQARYIAGCLALAALTLWPIATMWESHSHPLQELSTSAASPISLPISISPTIEFQQWALPLWLAGVVICSLRLLLGYRRMDVLRSTAIAADDNLRAAFERIGGARMRLAVSKLVDVPSVVGHWRPVILVPAAALAGLSTQQFGAILSHELAHLRRGDHWVNMIQCWIEVVLFYHPAAWWISARIRHERELCCDDAAVAACGDAAAYARALWTLERLRVETPRVALASNGGSLLYRMERLTGTSRTATPLLPGLAALAFAIALLPPSVREVKAQPPTGTVPPLQAPREDPVTVAPVPQRVAPQAPTPAPLRDVAPRRVDLKDEIETAWQESLHENSIYQREVLGVNILAFDAPEIRAMLQQVGELRTAEKALAEATDPQEQLAAEQRTRGALATVQAENARIHAANASMLEGTGRVYDRIIRAITFEGVPQATQSWILESMPNWVGRTYTPNVATNLRHILDGYLPRGSRVLLKREEGFELTIVLAAPLPQALVVQPALINAAYQPPAAETRVPTSQIEKTQNPQLDSDISLAEFWAGWEAGYVYSRLRLNSPDLETAASAVHKLSRDVSGEPEADARLREALDRLYSIIEEYRQRRVALEGKDQRPAEYRKPTSL